jgi:cell division protein FtsX
VALPLAYPVRNLFARRMRSALTVSVIALVVLATTLFVGLISSLKRTLVTTGSPHNLVVMRKGSSNDGSSSLSLESFQAIRFFDGIARDANDQPLVSPELVVQPFFYRLDGGRENVLVRGVEAASVNGAPPVSLAVHDNVVLVEGRMLQPSSAEAIVGRGVASRYQGAELGGELAFGRGRWRVVGVFEAGGSSFESEVWVDARELASDAKRPLPYSGLRVRVAEGADVEALVRRIDADPRFALEAKPETEYYAQQSESANTLYVLVIGLAVLAGVGAVFGATNTMYAAVQARIAEIGTLRALGFSRGSILFSFLVEAVLLSLAGFVVGALLAWAAGLGISALLGGIGFGAATFTTNVVTLRVGASDVGFALALALVIGIAGGLAPARRAANLRPVEALRRG